MESAHLQAFDTWIRGRFRELNTELENHYFELENPIAVDGEAPELKAALVEEGSAHVAEIAALPLLHLDSVTGYDLLGSVGLYMAALRRHELTNPEREATSPFPEASALAQRLAAGLGVAPRFATAHVNLSNLARRGEYKSFTSLPDELLFIDFNCYAILAYIRAADVLRRIPPLGATHPVSRTLFHDAEGALEDVARYNAELNERLDVRRFFFNVRPYFKPYRVGRHEYRGANAGDFAAINEIDLMLGLCRVGDPTYAGIVLEKMSFMTVGDQALLQACVRQRRASWTTARGRDGGWHPAGRRGRERQRIRAVCDAHARTAEQHHDLFVRRFIEQPAQNLDESFLWQITASGPPLPVLLHALRGSAGQADGGAAHRHRDTVRRSAAASRRLRGWRGRPSRSLTRPSGRPYGDRRHSSVPDGCVSDQGRRAGLFRDPACDQ